MDLPRDIWSLILQKLPRYALLRLSLCSHYTLTLARSQLKATLPPKLISISPTALIYNCFSLEATNALVGRLTHVTALKISSSQAFDLKEFTRIRKLRMQGSFGPLVFPNPSSLQKLVLHVHDNVQEPFSLPPSLRKLRIFLGALALPQMAHLTNLEAFKNYSFFRLPLATIETTFPKLASLDCAISFEDSTPGTAIIPLAIPLTKLKMSVGSVRSLWILKRLPKLRMLELEDEYPPPDALCLTNLRTLKVNGTPPELLLFHTLTSLSLHYPTTALRNLPNLRELQARVAGKDDLLEVTYCLTLKKLTVLTPLNDLLERPETAYLLTSLSNLNSLETDNFYPGSPPPQVLFQVLRQLPEFEILKWKRVTLVPAEFSSFNRKKK